MNQKVTCFLPCRKGSERVKRKNIKPFANFNNGLIEIKLNQLINSELIDEIILSTNDEEILEYAEKLNHNKINIHHRGDELSSSSTSTDELVGLAYNLIPNGHILWTHVTSPFINSKQYDQIIKSYHEKIKEGYDSLMTVTNLQSFLWDEKNPINYDRTIEKWPRTQTIKPIYEINSGVFLASSNIYKNHQDRIGKIPYLYILDKIISHDIDWPEDFIIAESMVEKNITTL